MEQLSTDIINSIKIKLSPEAQAQQASYQHADAENITAENGGEAKAEPEEAAQPFVREDKKVGRNEPCPCGSKKKYKQCHGKLTA